MASKTLPAGPFPDCAMCKDTGLQHFADFTPVYRFCACPRGRKLQEDTPNLVDESNARERALGIGVKK